MLGSPRLVKGGDGDYTPYFPVIVSDGCGSLDLMETRALVLYSQTFYSCPQMMVKGLWLAAAPRR